MNFAIEFEIGREIEKIESIETTDKIYNNAKTKFLLKMDHHNYKSP